MISVTILTFQSERFIQKVLESLATFDEILILDTGSTDKTLEIAEKFANVRIHKNLFSGFGPLHNLAASLCKNDWILSIDSDEVLSKELIQEIKYLDLDKKTAYSIPFHNFYNGKWIRWCGWYPDRHVRLYNRQATSFSNHFVHEKIQTDSLITANLQHPIHHFSYSEVSDFLRKMQNYSDLFADQNVGKKKSSPWKAIRHGAFAFIKSYLIKRGFLGGYEGFLISIYNAHTAFYKYLKLYEKNKKIT
jgi:glycosyltransferase involved in cell wall biosynthesis